MEFWWGSFAELGVTRLYDVLALRQRVFVVEQDCPYLDADGLDPACHHLLGYRDGVLVAYVRVLPMGVQYPDAHAIGRVVTAPEARRVGLGRPLMREGLRRLRETCGEGPVKLGAQAYLQGFYESLGYRVCGPGYLEDGIPHLPMKLAE